MAQREAFYNGSHAADSFHPESIRAESVRTRARERYPLPKVERPRVVTDALNCQWKFSERRFQVRCRADSVWGEWQAAGYSWRPSPDLVLLWADLIAHPSEFADDEG